MSEIAFVTGTDRETFLHATVLWQSFLEWAPTHRLYVCDFGMEEPQRAFFAAKDALLPPPADLGQGHHPWRCKAALTRFLPADWDTVVWLDADMLLVRPLAPPLRALAARMEADGQILAASHSYAAQFQDGRAPVTLQGFIDTNGSRSPAFQPRLAAAGIDLGQPYLNSGFFLSRSRVQLAAWDELARSWPLEFLFEQNAFNLVAANPAATRVLEGPVWNVCDCLLSEVTERAGVLHGRGGTLPQILHATSSRLGELFRQEVAVAGFRWAGPDQLRWFEAEVLRRYQADTLGRFIQSNATLLRTTGVLVPA